MTAGARALSLACLLLAALGAPAAGGAESRVRQSTAFDSAALGRPMAYSVYLPPGYDGEDDEEEDAPGRRFPVIYLLHGLGGNERDWLLGAGVDAIADDLIARGAMPPAILVMPDGGVGWYVDSAAIGGPGDYETAIAADLIAHVDATYRTIAAREGRAIAGLSMGGYGAVRLAFFHPDLFVAAGSLSGAIFPDIPSDDDVSDLQQDLFRGAFGTPVDAGRFNAANVFGPIAELAAAGAAPPLLLTVGDDDRFRLDRGAHALFTALRDAGLPVELRITDGGHVWPLWAQQIQGVLVFLGGYLSPPRDDG